MRLKVLVWLVVQKAFAPRAVSDINKYVIVPIPLVVFPKVIVPSSVNVVLVGHILSSRKCCFSLQAS